MKLILLLIALTVIIFSIPYLYLRSLIPTNYDQIFDMGYNEVINLNKELVPKASNIQPFSTYNRNRKPTQILGCASGTDAHKFTFSVPTSKGTITPTFEVITFGQKIPYGKRNFSGSFFQVTISDLAEFKGNVNKHEEEARDVAKEIISDPRMLALLNEGKNHQEFDSDNELDHLRWIESAPGKIIWLFELERLQNFKKAQEIEPSNLPGHRFEGLPTPAYVIPRYFYKCTFKV